MNASWKVIIIEAIQNEVWSEQIRQMILQGVGEPRMEVRRLVLKSEASLVFPPATSEWPTDLFHKSFLIFLLNDLTSALAQQVLAFLERENGGHHALIAMENPCESDLVAVLRSDRADLLHLPPRDYEVRGRVSRYIEIQRGAIDSAQELKERMGIHKFIGESSRLMVELEKLPLIARTDSTVLIQGETGTGKEVCAQTLHYLSPRKGGPFVALNCGTLPLDLVENELFGHEAGAYTGAAKAARGLVAEAEGGTLFLDEIDALPLLTQVKLLRFLQEKEYRPVGSARYFKANVRILAATNSDLLAAVRLKAFRQDLLYRLNTISVELPPLRDRDRDICLLANHFLRRIAQETGCRTRTLSPAAETLLLRHNWPGNIRELQNVIERAAMFCQTELIQTADLRLPGSINVEPNSGSFKRLKSKLVADFEKHYLETLMHQCQGNVSEAARVAQKNRRAFFHLIRKYDIDMSKFRVALGSHSSLVTT